MNFKMHSIANYALSNRSYTRVMMHMSDITGTNRAYTTLSGILFVICFMINFIQIGT